MQIIQLKNKQSVSKYFTEGEMWRAHRLKKTCLSWLIIREIELRSQLAVI